MFNPQPKQVNYRNRRLLNLAHRVTECQFQIEGVCQGHSAHGCEPAHSNHSVHGHAMGQKSGDDFHIASCRKCHLYYDAHKLPEDKELELFNAARERTFAYYRKFKWLAKVGYADNK
ncbi:MAG: hypothetical protein WC733_00040 [Methylophilus sp.]|jgi:hypothetical protein